MAADQVLGMMGSFSKWEWGSLVMGPPAGPLGVVPAQAPWNPRESGWLTSSQSGTGLTGLKIRNQHSEIGPLAQGWHEASGIVWTVFLGASDVSWAGNSQVFLTSPSVQSTFSQVEQVNIDCCAVIWASAQE